MFSLFLSWPHLPLQLMALIFEPNLMKKFTCKKIPFGPNSSKNFLSDHLKTKNNDDKRSGNHSTLMGMDTWALLKLTRDAETCSDLINYSRQNPFLWELSKPLKPNWKLQPHTVTITFQRLSSNTFFNTWGSIMNIGLLLTELTQTLTGGFAKVNLQRPCQP